MEQRQAALKALMHDIENNNKRIFKQHDWKVSPSHSFLLLLLIIIITSAQH